MYTRNAVAIRGFGTCWFLLSFVLLLQSEGSRADNPTTSDVLDALIAPKANIEGDWSLVKNQADWAARRYHTAVSFDGKLWVMGGMTLSGNVQSDVWYSEDGVSWTRAVASAPWAARMGHSGVVFDNRMWILGGSGNPTNYSDVWWSTDGVNWTESTAAAPWTSRWFHASVVYDGKIWVLGGWHHDGTLNHQEFRDVWFSPDGVNWTELTDTAAWSARWNHGAVVFDKKMWVLGGNQHYTPMNDVWYSTDGNAWYQAVAQAPWSGRFAAGCVSLAGNLWVYGGEEEIERRNDIWYSPDGVNWTRQAAAAPWTARGYFPSVTFDGKIWVLGGDAVTSMTNDVYTMTVKGTGGCFGDAARIGRVNLLADAALFALAAFVLIAATLVQTQSRGVKAPETP